MAGTPGHSGGPRQGVQGQSYANRSDLNAGPRVSAPAGAAAPPSAGAAGAPPSAIPIGASSSRPDEHIMTGVGAGPGPGPREMGLVPAGANPNDILEQLRAIYAIQPNRDLGDLIETMMAGDYKIGGQFA